VDRESFPDGIVLLNRRKDGARFHCHWHFTVIRNQPEANTSVIAFASDVTARLRGEEERRLLETNLRHAQKMQSLGTLAGGIAHDFNNILLAISGNTRLAMQDLAPDHPAQVSLAEVEKASARASTVVNQILTFGHREELPQHPVNLRTIVEESLHLLQATFATRITIRSNIVAPAPIVLADPAQIHQVLVNLATNAAHAMSESGGSLTVGLHEIEVSEALSHKVADLKAGTYHCITVSDTGTGMSDEVRERIFEPFFTTKQRGQGTGLGLSVVHGIIRSHGGAIEVQSAHGVGTTFRVYLPAMQGHVPAAASAASVPRERGQGQRILYLDDEEPLVYLITRVLQRLGYEVAGFIDSRVALETFKLNPESFDAVVTDLSMPGMPGTEFARQVLQIRPELPVVMTSGYVRTEDRDQALQIGVRELLLKPNTVEGLGEVLHRLLQGSRSNG
jgi:signal transduction histidine kinase/ActR/RegA family two-component response regulator